MLKLPNALYHINRIILRSRRVSGQGCPLSPTLFTIYISEMEQAFRKGQDGRIVVGNSKVWSLAYADDIVLIENREES